MKTAVQVIFLLLLSLNSFSQTLIWEKLIDYFPSQEEEIYSLDQDSDTTFVFTTATGGNTAIVKAKLDGDTLWKRNTDIASWYNSERIASYLKDTLMHFGSKCFSPCTASNFLFQKVSSLDGTTFSSWDYGDAGVKNFLHKALVLPDGGFLAAGQRGSTYYYYLSLMKLDKAGNMLWYKKYRDNSYTTDVIVNRKGNYLLSASTGDHIFAPVTYHPYFIEISPAGDSITSKYLIVHADTVNEQKNNWTWGMLQNEDGDYVFTISIDSVQQKGGTLLDRYAAVVMMDTLFNIKWKLYLNKGTGGQFYPSRAIELKDSSYVLVVMNTNPYSSTFYYYKISKTGQILDQKTFTSSVCNQVHTTEIKLLSDSSLLISGACKDYENAYIARIDSVGLPIKIDTCASFRANFKAEQQGDSIMFTSTSSGGYAYVSTSEWKFSDSTASASFNSKIQLTGTQDSVWARLIATNLYGCKDTIAKKIKVNHVLSVLKPATDNTIAVEIFPNPAKETITIKTPGIINSKLTFYTSQGQPIKQQIISGQQAEIDLSIFPQGLYLFQVQNGEKMSTGKFMKE